MKKYAIACVVSVLACGQAAAGTASLEALRRSAPEGAADSLKEIPAAESRRVDLEKSLNLNQLGELLRDPDPGIRLAAVRASRRQIQNSSLNRTIIALLLSDRERTEVRAETARTLSFASGYSEVQRALISVIRDPLSPRELRPLCYRALYKAASRDRRVEEFLSESVRVRETDRDARRAAIWALFESAGQPRVQELLSGIAAGNEEETTRIEALKSVYGGNGYPRVKDLLRRLASDPRELRPVRLTAIKALSGVQDSSVTRFLENMIRQERDTELRAAAVAAAEPDMHEVRRYFHLEYRLQNGELVSPIDQD